MLKQINNKGIGLVEAVLAVAFAVVLVVALLSLTTFNVQNSFNVTQRQEATKNTSAVLEKLRSEKDTSFETFSNKGFTLIELLVVVLLITVVSIISSDMIISLTSTSTKVQNKISLEEDYSFLNAKLTKLIQDANSVSYNPATKMLLINHSTKTYTLVFDEAAGSLILENLQLTDSEIGKSTNNPFVLTVTGTNPQVVYLSFSISKDSSNERLKTEIKFEKTVTLNKTYQE